MQKTARKFRSVLFAIVLVILPAEILCRIATSIALEDYTGAAIREAMGELRLDEEGDAESGRTDGERARETIHPYIGYVATPGLRLDEMAYPVTRGRLARQVGPGATPWWLGLRANNWGFWSPHPFPHERGDDEFVVAVLGGSVAMWLGLQGRDTLEQELGPRLAGREIVVLNLALPGFKQPQQGMLLSHALSRGMTFDSVVNIDGFNEAAIGYQNAIHEVSPGYPRADLWSVLVTGVEHSNRVMRLQSEVFRYRERADRHARRASGWSRVSNILGIVFMTRANAARADEKIAESVLHTALVEDLPAYRDFAARGPVAADGAERDEQVLDLWAEGSRNLAALCAGRGIPYVHVLQPTLHDASPRPSKPLTREERRIEANLGGAWGVWREGVRRFYPRFRERAEGLREAGVVFADLSYLFESTGETIYYDICHYNQRGNELLAKEVAALVAAELP